MAVGRTNAWVGVQETMPIEITELLPPRFEEVDLRFVGMGQIRHGVELYVYNDNPVTVTATIEYANEATNEFGTEIVELASDASYMISSGKNFGEGEYMVAMGVTFTYQGKTIFADHYAYARW